MLERPEFHPLPPEPDKSAEFFPARKVAEKRKAAKEADEAGWQDLTPQLDPDKKEAA